MSPRNSQQAWSGLRAQVWLLAALILMLQRLCIFLVSPLLEEDVGHCRVLCSEDGCSSVL